MDFRLEASAYILQRMSAISKPCIGNWNIYGTLGEQFFDARCWKTTSERTCFAYRLIEFPTATFEFPTANIVCILKASLIRKLSKSCFSKKLSACFHKGGSVNRSSEISSGGCWNLL
jgi:hypothetical protein